MYFTSGSDRAFEQLMQGKPVRGKVILQPQGKEFFTSRGNDFFT